jgi:glycerol-3-phosphate dehydrogenase (NAD+)
MGAGFCDALGLGCSSKASIVREGLHEIAEFCKLFYKDFDQNTMLESCGISDIVATAFGGRNRKVSEEFGRRLLAMAPILDVEVKDEDEQSKELRLKMLWDQVEKDLLNGQKMQGLGTLIEVISCLDAYQLKYDCDLKHGNHNHYNGRFPLFYRIMEISTQGAKLQTLFDW